MVAKRVVGGTFLAAGAAASLYVLGMATWLLLAVLELRVHGLPGEIDLWAIRLP
jgi:hypothetical protein